MLSRLFKFNSIRTVTTTPSGTYGMLYARKYKGSVSNDTESKLVYSGPFSPAVKAIKLVSLVSSSTALSVTPFLIAFGKEGIPLLGKSMIVSITLLASWGTTALLHLMTRAYIHKLYFNKSEEIFTAHTTTLFYRTRKTRIHLSDIQQPSDGVFAFSFFGTFFTTFVAKKRPFYLHQELMRESNTELYMRLLGMSSKKIEEENARTKQDTSP